MNPQWKLGSALHTFGPTAKPAKGPWYESGYVGWGGVGGVWLSVLMIPKSSSPPCITYRSHIPVCLEHPLPPSPPFLRLEMA